MTFKEPCLAASLLPPSVECNDDTVFNAMKQLRYPVMATLKKDGVRGLRLNGTLLSRKLKKIPNKAIREASVVMPGGMDVECWNKTLDYNTIQSIVMSFEHPRANEIQFHVIDWFMPNTSYAERMHSVQLLMPSMPPHVKFSPPVWCQNAEQLFAFEQVCIEEAGEGICFRTPHGYYKQGRSSLKEQYLVKLARWKYDEAEIIGFVEQQENRNADRYDATGKMDRSMSQDGMVGKNTLGSFIVRNTAMQVFPIGTGVGLTEKFRRDIWHSQDKYLGRTIKYKSKQHGPKILPRQPIFCGFRDRKVD